jgi:hypothetical protein
MKLINFIVWLSAGAVIGWFAQRLIHVEHMLTNKPIPIKDSSSE